MRLIAISLLLAAPLTAQTASVEGVVVNQANGQPLGDVHVRVLTGDLATVTVERVYGAMSDRAGHFSISGMKPGLYLLVPERIGFVFARQPGPIPAAVLALKPGQHLTDQKVEMLPCGFVSGRVVDDSGDPVPGASLQLRAGPPDTDFVNPFAVPLPNYTDDRGEFRVVVSPGKYYLQAMPRNFRPPMESRPGTAPVMPYVATYYPSAGTAGEASPIQVKPGQEVTSLEIRLTHARPPAPGTSVVPSLSIGGLVTGVPAGARATVTLLRGVQNPATPQPVRGTLADGEGKFLFRGSMPPGNYRVLAQCAACKVPLQSQAVEVQITGTDVENLQLQLAPGEDLGGSLEIAGDAAGDASARRIAVKLEAIDPAGASETSSARVGIDGSFRIPAVFPGRYRLRVEPLSAGAFIRSAMLDDAVVDDAGFELSRGVRGDRLKVVLSLNAGQMSGTVLGHDGAPLSSPLAEVLVWNNAAQVMPEHNPVTGSRYALRDLRPGKYRVLAVDAFDFTNLAGANRPEEFAKALLAESEEIEVKEGMRLVQNLKIVAKEDIHVQPKQ